MGQLDIDSRGSEIAVRGGEIQPLTHTELFRMCEQVAKARLCPEDLRGSPADVMLVYIGARALGFDGWVGVQNGYVIKGRIRWPAEMLLAAVQAHPECEYFNYGFEGTIEDGTRSCWVESKRSSRAAANPVVTFTLEDAKRAGLYPGRTDRNNEPSNWVKFTDDQLFWKTALRDIRRNWSFITQRAAALEDVDEPEAPRERNITPTKTQVASTRGATDPAIIDLVGAGKSNGSPAAGAPNGEGRQEGEQSPTRAKPPLPVCPKCQKPVKRGAVEVDGQAYHKSHAPDPKPQEPSQGEKPPGEAPEPPAPAEPVLSEAQGFQLEAAIRDRAEHFAELDPSITDVADLASRIAVSILGEGGFEVLKRAPAAQYDALIFAAKNAGLPS